MFCANSNQLGAADESQQEFPVQLLRSKLFQRRLIGVGRANTRRQLVEGKGDDEKKTLVIDDQRFFLVGAT